MPRPFMVLALAISMAIGTISYFSGSTPEWTVVKSSVGLFTFVLLGKVMSVLVTEPADRPAKEIRGARVDLTLPVAAPDDSGNNQGA